MCAEWSNTNTFNTNLAYGQLPNDVHIPQMKSNIFVFSLYLGRQTQVQRET